MSAWSDTRVLVTGAQGFIGSWVAERLLDEGAHVFVLDRPARALSRFALRGLDERCAAVAADLRDVDSLRAALDGHAIEAVFHLAAAAIVGAATASPLATLEVNVAGTWNLLEACRRASVAPARIVVASSDKAYGVHEQLPCGEEHALRPRYPYDVSKACADLVARSYAHTFGLPVAVTRMGNVFGGGDFNFSRLIPGTIRALLAGEQPVIRSDGRLERDYLYAQDAASAYLAVAASLADPKLWGRAWNASIGSTFSVLRIVEQLIEISGAAVEPDVRGEGTPHGELTRLWLDSSAMLSELGWAPRWRLRPALEETYRWYEQAAYAVAHPAVPLPAAP